jgi:hypothetical protein
MEFDEEDPRYQVRILAMRLDTLGKEKERLESELKGERTERLELDGRVSAMEKSFQRGFGMLVIIPVLGTIAGLISAYGKVVFAPWLTK